MGFEPADLSSLLAVDRVLANLRVSNPLQMIRQMTRVAAAGTSLNYRAVQAAILAHGRVSPFTLGRGVAIPHAVISGTERPLGVFARIEPTLSLPSPDNVPADLVLLILSPTEASLLRALACGARRLRDKDVVERVRSAACRDAIYAVLTGDDWRQDRSSLPAVPASADRSTDARGRAGPQVYGERMPTTSPIGQWFGEQCCTGLMLSRSIDVSAGDERLAGVRRISSSSPAMREEIWP